jgi:hypothetical protein
LGDLKVVKSLHRLISWHGKITLLSQKMQLWNAAGPLQSSENERKDIPIKVVPDFCLPLT